MKRKIVKLIATWISFVFVFFLAFSFVNYNINPETWGSDGRTFFSVLCIFSIVIAAFITDVVLDEK